MATKTKKPSSKSTSKAKTSKKSPSRLDRVIKKLNLARPRNQFIAAFLVVGVLGGGYFAYQSFAATTTNVASYFGEKVVVYRDIPECRAGTSGYESQVQKNWNKILWIDGKGSCAASATKLYISQDGTYKMCAVVKGIGTISFPGFTLREVSFYNPNDFKQVCSLWFNKKANSVNRIVVRNNGGSKINISTITLDRAGEAINSSTPAPAK